jgi:hypothetical protein
VHKRIGEFLLEKKAITEPQLKEILEYSSKTGKRLGDAALEMGILTPEKMIRLFGRSFRVDFFSLQPEFFPRETRDLLTREQILRYGALPLGYKSERRWFFRRDRRLNVGMLNPDRADAFLEVDAIAREAGRVKIYLVLPGDFLRVAEKVYGIGEAEILTRKPGELDPVLSLFLQRES